MKYHSTYQSSSSLIRLAVACACFIAGLTATAQTGTNPGTNDQVIIMREYEAKVKDADKISLSPNIPEEEERTPKLSYKVPERDYKDIPFEPNPLKPLGMSTDKLERFNSSYVKLGFGTQLAPLAELMYNDNKSKKIKYGFFYDHLSMYGFKIKNQRFSDDKVGAYVKYNPGKVELSGAFRFHNLRTHFYGSPDTTFEEKAVRQNLRDYDLNIGLKNSVRNKNNIDYAAAIRGNYFQETYGKGYEYFVNFKVGATYTFKKYHSAYAGFQADVSEYKSDSNSVFRTVFLTHVGYGFNNDDWKAHAAITIAADGSKVFILPDLYIEKRLYQHKLLAYAGWEVRFQKNSFKSLAERNNFINSTIQLQNTRIGDIFGGVKGTVDVFSYNIRFAYRGIGNMPLYYTDYFDNKRFYVGYDQAANVFNGLVELGYNHKEDLRLLASMELNSYSLHDNAKAWYEPLVRASIKGSYTIQKKIVIGADIYAFSNYYGFIAPDNIRNIHGTVDANLNIEYIFNKKLSFFGQLNNIAHQRYQVWANYQVYGINGLIGAKFCF